MKRIFTLAAFLLLSAIGFSQSWEQLRMEEKVSDSYKWHYKNMVYMADQMGLNGEMIADLDRIFKNYKKNAGQLEKSILDDETKVAKLMEMRAKRDEAMAKLMGSEDFTKYESYVNNRIREAISAKSTASTKPAQ